MSPPKKYLYVMVRKDLPPAQIVVQAIHAAVQQARQPDFPRDGDEPHLVLLEADSEEDLRTWYSCCCWPFARSLFCEPDLGDRVTAWACGPVAADDPDRKFLLSMPLLTLPPTKEPLAMTILNASNVVVHQITLPAEIAVTVDRWGNYHRCDMKTAEQLRMLRFLVSNAKHRAAARFRYDRKTKLKGHVFEKVYEQPTITVPGGNGPKQVPIGPKVCVGRRLVRTDAPPPAEPIGHQVVMVDRTNPDTGVGQGQVRKARIPQGWQVILDLCDAACEFYRSKPVPLDKDEVLTAVQNLEVLRKWYQDNAPQVLTRFRDRSVRRPDRTPGV